MESPPDRGAADGVDGADNVAGVAGAEAADPPQAASIAIDAHFNGPMIGMRDPLSFSVPMRDLEDTAPGASLGSRDVIQMQTGQASTATTRLTLTALLEGARGEQPRLNLTLDVSILRCLRSRSQVPSFSQPIGDADRDAAANCIAITGRVVALRTGLIR